MRASFLITKLLPRLSPYSARSNIHMETKRPLSTPSDVVRCLTDVDNTECPAELEFLKQCSPNSKSGSLSKDDATSIAEVIAQHEDIFGTETQQFLRQYRGKLNEYIVIEVLNLLKNPEKCVKFFIWAGRQIGYTHTVPVYDALLDLIETSDAYKVPDEFLREIKDDDREVLGKFLNAVVRNRCRGGHWNAALEELGRLKTLGYKASNWTYNALIKVFLKAGKLDSARLVHREMKTMGFKMNAITLGCFVYSLCKLGNWKEALGLIEDEKFTSDTVIYNQMISGLCDASLFDEALMFLSRMKAVSCLPNVLTYHALLRGCLRERKLNRCKRILSLMIKEGCYPSRRIIDSLVHAFCQSRDCLYAYKLLKKAPACGYEPGYVLYNVLLGGICEAPNESEMELAEKVYSETLLKGVALNKITFSKYVKCLCETGKVDEAYRVINDMMNRGYVPDSGTYSKVISYVCNASRVEEAFLLFQNMKKNGVSVDVYTYTMIIDTFCKAGLIEQARKWFDEMGENHCAPSVVTFTALIHAYLKVGNISEAEAVFQMMVSNGCVPNLVTYTALIDGLCKARKIDEAYKIYTKMKDCDFEVSNNVGFEVSCDESIKPNVYTYGAMVAGLCKGNRLKEAYELFEEMPEGNCKPNHFIYDALIDGFCKAGQLVEAQEVLMKMLDQGFTPDTYTYSSFIDRMFKENRLDLALKVLGKMVGDSLAPNVVIYTEMVDGLCKMGKVDEAWRLMCLMEEKGCNPNVVTYTAILDGYGKTGRVDKCQEVFEVMLGKGCAPNNVTYSVLIKHFCAAGWVDEGHRMLEQMKQTYWPSLGLGNKRVIEGFNRDFLLSHGILSEFGGELDVPVSPAYRVLIDSFIKCGRLSTASDLLKEFSFVSSSLQSLYLSLMFSLCLCAEVGKAVDLLSYMVAKSGGLEVRLIAHLVTQLVRNHRNDEALELSFAISQMETKYG